MKGKSKKSTYSTTFGVDPNTASCMSRCIAGIVGEIAEYSLLNRKPF